MGPSRSACLFRDPVPPDRVEGAAVGTVVRLERPRLPAKEGQEGTGHVFCLSLEQHCLAWGPLAACQHSKVAGPSSEALGV